MSSTITELVVGEEYFFAHTANEDTCYHGHFRRGVVLAQDGQFVVIRTDYKEREVLDATQFNAYQPSKEFFNALDG